MQGILRSGPAAVVAAAGRLPRALWAICGAALITVVLLAVSRGAPPVTPLALVGFALVFILILLGDMTAIELRNGSLLSPAPALLIAGLAMTAWPLLLAAVVVGTLAPGVLRGRTRRAIAESGGRALALALVVPIDQLARPVGALPLSTLASVLALPVIGAVVYAVEIGVGVAMGEGEGPLAPRLRAQLRGLQWYALAMVPVGGVLGHLWGVGPLSMVPGLITLVLTQHLFRGQVALGRATTDLEDLAAQHRARGERLEHLQALATAMIGTLDVHEMLQILCVRLAALLDAPHGWVVIVEKGERLRLMASHNIRVDEDGDAQPFVNPESYYGVMRRGRVVLMTDEYRHDLTPIAALHESVLWTTVLSIPLVAEKRVLGVICLAFEQLRGLDAEEQRVLSAFSHQAAVTLENARLFDELRHKQVELIQSSKLAAVGTFAAGIAHEFNNLLGSMLGYAELGHSSDDLSEKNHSLDVVIQACRRGRSITRGLLTFARRQEHQRALADITDSVDETLTLVELDLRKTRINIVREMEAVPRTVCDLGQISQVVLNLITNARDAMRPGGGTLTIGLRERQGVIELSVTDTGSGIPADLLDKIFEPFVTTKGALGGSQTPGTGLGLSVSYGIVKEHGGTISVTSEVGRGTTMTVRLPVVTEVPAPEEEREAQPA